MCENKNIEFAENEGYTPFEVPKNQSKSEFEEELENYLPTPENTDKIKKPLPVWVIPIISSLITCVVLFVLHSLFILPNMRPYAVISYVNSENTAPENTIHDNKNADNIYSDVASGVVYIESTSSYQSFFGISTTSNTGTGIILSRDGYILTSVSVSGDGESTVTLPSGAQYTAKTVGYDNTRDISIIKIDAENLPALTLGNSDTVRAGNSAVVISNILSSNNLGPSVTTGVICGVNTGVSVQSGGSVNLIQTDALTGTSSSGGCILNANGEVVGMITSAFTSNTDGISFAIPSNDIKTVFQSIITTGEAPDKLLIGITGSDSSHGVLVESIVDDSPAEKSGIKTGDLILKVQGTPVTSISEINKIRDSHKKGDTLKISLYRDGEILDVNIVL